METKEKINQPLNRLNSLINSFKDVVGQNTRSGKLFDIINCSFMAKNLAIIIEVFHSNSEITIQIAACLAALGLLNWVLIFCGLVLLLRKATSDKVNKNK